MTINHNKSIIEQLLPLTVEELMDLLPNNITLGEGNAASPLRATHLNIAKYIDNTYCISYVGSHRDKKQSDQDFLFETCYCHDLRMGLIETYIKVKAYTNKLFNEE